MIEIKKCAQEVGIVEELFEKWNSLMENFIKYDYDITL